jgi:MFS family permease
MFAPMPNHAEPAPVRKPTEEYPNFLRNYLLGIANGVLFNSGLSFFSRTTVIPSYMSGLGAPSVLISLTSLFESLGWHLPQLFAAKFIVNKPLKLPLYRAAALLRVAGLAMACSSALVAGSSPFWAITLFVLGFGLFAIASGFGGVVFIEVLAKTCPKEKRGSYFGWRAILSGFTGLYIGLYVIKPIFTRHHGAPGMSASDASNYFVAFAIGTLLIAISFFLFLRQKEPVQSNLPAKRSMAAQLRAARSIVVEDHAFRRFILFRGTMMLWYAGIPYDTLFARDHLQATEADMGNFISWDAAGLIAANVLWSFISNRIGNRTLLVMACALASVVSAGVVAFASGGIGLPSWTFGVIFFLSAAADSAIGNGGINYALEIVPEPERPTYLGIMNMWLASALIVATIAGSLRDVIGYSGLYVTTGCVALAGLVMIVRLPEPRRAAKVVIL